MGSVPDPGVHHQGRARGRRRDKEVAVGRPLKRVGPDIELRELPGEGLRGRRAPAPDPDAVDPEPCRRRTEWVSACRPAPTSPSSTPPLPAEVPGRDGARRPGAEIGQPGRVQDSVRHPRRGVEQNDQCHHGLQSAGRVAGVDVHDLDPGEPEGRDVRGHGPEVAARQGHVDLRRHLGLALRERGKGRLDRLVDAGEVEPLLGAGRNTACSLRARGPA